jgi:hypothetical protein
MSDEMKDEFDVLPEKWIVGEKGASLSAQRDYIDYHHYLDFDERSTEDLLALGKKLLSAESSLDDKKQALAVLAHAGTIEAYKILEEYAKKADAELEDWAVLALQECQVFLEVELEGSSKGMISGGLGGDRHRMRYFLAACGKEDRVWMDAEQAVVDTSFRNVGEHLGGEVERIDFHQGCVSMEALIPLEVAVAEFAEKGIKTVNQAADLFVDDYYVRNDRVASEAEVRDWAGEVRGGR